MKATKAIIAILLLYSAALGIAGGFPPFSGPNYMGIPSHHVTIGDTVYTNVWGDIHRSIDVIAMDNFTFLPAGIITYENVVRGDLWPDYTMWITPHYIHNDTGWARGILWGNHDPVNSTNATAFNITWKARQVGLATITITAGGTVRNGTNPGTTMYPGYIYVHPKGTSSFDASTTNATSIHLSWSKGTAMDKAVIRGSQSTYPTSPQSGTDVYNSTGTSYDHTVSGGQTWYYSVWGWNQTQGFFSLSYQTDSASTPSGNHAPNKPITPSPANNTAYMDVYNIYMNCTVSDPDGGTLSVHYYWGNGSFIGTITGVSSGGTSSLFLPSYWHRTILGYSNCTWVPHDTTEYWYAVADDGSLTNQSATWNFHTGKAWDLNVDKHVNYLDVSGLVGHYGMRVFSPGRLPWDINEDTYTNYLDVSGLVGHYGQNY